ncbi:MAG: hypothetical protein IKF79_04205 [Methanosphaera sp.]|nr:hypothetical protein [Methanosphaera sp.]
MENKEFEEILKNASDIENITDKKYKELYNDTMLNLTEFKIVTQSILDNGSKEIDILTKFKDKTSNETQKKYLEIEIKRLQTEQRGHEKLAENGKEYERYLNGEITASKYIERSNTLNNDTMRLDNEVGIIKDETITYLQNHQDLNNTITKLNLDEDFYLYELDGAGNGKIYIK